ncbi:MAG: methyltransferase domain-containing protein [Propionibacteriales bacterium]|nr:methyltransferase domain-containing protein [Propionibacteriales bacterium]
MTTQYVPSTEQIRGAWDALTPGFDEFVTPKTMTLADEVVRSIGLRPGMRLLDVAAGSGALSIPAARVGADVVATDLSPAMIEQLNARAQAERLANLRGLTMDGHDLDLEDDTFDLAVSVNGISLFPDLPRALSELVRVTRTGGRVVIVTFGPLPTVEFIVFFASAVQAAVPGITPLPTDPPPLPFQVAEPGVLRQRLAEAGLRDIQIETITWDMVIDSPQHFWAVFTSSNPIGAQMVADLTDEQQEAVKQVLDGMLRERSGGTRGATLHAEVNIGTGTV